MAEIKNLKIISPSGFIVAPKSNKHRVVEPEESEEFESGEFESDASEEFDRNLEKSPQDPLQDKYLELLMCPPKYLSTKIENNKWMTEAQEDEIEVNVDKAMAQFFHMYCLISQDALVYLLPPKEGLQDQIYVVNAGAVLPHLKKTVVLSNFRAKGRPGEEDELSRFMDIMRYEQYECPYYFEGEAELKFIKDNIYIGGYGIRTELKALQWLEETFDARIIKIKETDPKRYHLDCCVFPISKDKILLATDMVDDSTLKEIEDIVEIIPVNKQDSQFAITNNLRVGSVIYTMTDIMELKKDDEAYLPEKQKNENLEKICRDLGLELIFINLSEFKKSGAALSCCVLHLTYITYEA
jgi:N-dimethylarginine dimethylaminohydrolase